MRWQIKILAAENYKGGVRLSVVCGGRALEAAQAMRARQAEIGALLSAKASETANAVHRVYDEYTALKFTTSGCAASSLRRWPRWQRPVRMHPPSCRGWTGWPALGWLAA